MYPETQSKGAEVQGGDSRNQDGSELRGCGVEAGCTGHGLLVLNGHQGGSLVEVPEIDVEAEMMETAVRGSFSRIFWQADEANAVVPEVVQVVKSRSSVIGRRS
eukprot:7394362-Heterocapsa_arctica.AAC.1